MRKKEIKTVFGSLKPEVNIFPIYYLAFVYMTPVIFPFKIIGEKTLFLLWVLPEHISEGFQFLFFFGAFIFSFRVLLIKKFRALFARNFPWLVSTILLLIVSFEEVSFYIKFLPYKFLSSLKENSLQGEINIHTYHLVSSHMNYLLPAAFFFLGYLGWKFFPRVEVFPSKDFALYFLFTSLLSTRNFSGIYSSKTYLMNKRFYEFLVALGLFLHFRKKFLNINDAFEKS